MTIRSRALAAALTAIVLLPGLAAAAPAPAARAIGSADDVLLRIGTEVQGFGGFFYDATGRPTIYLRDPHAESAQPALAGFGEDVRILRGDFEFAQLIDWRAALRPALALPGVVYLDADERSNRVVVAVDPARAEPARTRQRVAAMLAARHVPAAAVTLVELGPVRELVGVARHRRTPPVVDIQSTIRPAPGGVQISFEHFPFITLCTLGFNAYRGKAFGFVTNSHCTADRGGVDGTRFSQGDYHGAPIATEIADPPYFTNDAGCPPGRKCRYSDSAFVQYDHNSKKLGKYKSLAHPRARGRDVGSLVLKPAGSRLTITANAATPFFGQVLNKIGRTTGWTYGPVIATCADVNSSETEFTLLCQGVVQAGADGGDSGSPVFFQPSAKSPKVSLAGILWGGGTDSLGESVFVFSPRANIEGELGALRTH